MPRLCRLDAQIYACHSDPKHIYKSNIGIIGKPRQVGLEIYPGFEHLADILLITHIFVDKIRKDRERDAVRICVVLYRPLKNIRLGVSNSTIKTFVARNHRSDIGLIGNVRKARLDIFPGLEHLVDIIVDHVYLRGKTEKGPVARTGVCYLFFPAVNG
ncbi:hypothetical protein PILCRDRAFT_823166 [Piloderma croceum F 1598]|uniref:Uncharacterized protein n=1 Tax=Piloderma croceum (strain F 1598) TaxID=765440 RepID=A0A0C3B069_PILCF|nr:hypothetical protein PILCRDRAFT_823166 [Piloderma croceum F 1598]